MEKYFEISKNHEVYNGYFEWLEFKNKINKAFKDYASKREIEASEFLPRQDTVGIVPTKADNEKFEKFLKQPDGRIRFFKKNTAYAKEWVQMLRNEGIKISHKPRIAWYFNWYKSRTRLFNIESKLYGSYECEQDEFKLPDGFIEMKASKFFKIIEDWEESQK